ncbi:DUF3802 family protein [Vibrio lentus]|nr:DUF3802 family protein [Vibrio lentus]
MISKQHHGYFRSKTEIACQRSFSIVERGRAVVADLGEVLAGVWAKKATNEQIVFLDEYIALVKNLFDTAVAKYD